MLRTVRMNVVWKSIGRFWVNAHSLVRCTNDFMNIATAAEVHTKENGGKKAQRSDRMLCLNWPRP